MNESRVLKTERSIFELMLSTFGDLAVPPTLLRVSRKEMNLRNEM